MIKSITINDTQKMATRHAPEVKGFKKLIGKEMTFTDGINLIAGPNGIGKSTLLQEVAKQMCCYYTGFFRLDGRSFDDLTKAKFHTPTKEEADEELAGIQYIPRDGLLMQHDGQACFVGSALFNGDSVAADLYGFAAFAANYEHMTSSAGQNNMTTSDTIFYTAEKINWSDYRKKNIEHYTKNPNYNAKKEKVIMDLIINPPLIKGKPTILIDEADSNLDILNTVKHFRRIQELSEHFQIIMTSHSPLAYDIPNLNIIDMKNGYSKKVQRELKAFYVSVGKEVETPMKSLKKPKTSVKNTSQKKDFSL